MRAGLPLLVIAGPTAAGKTTLALQVAETVGGEIVSADAFQIYQGMALGTAQPSAEEQARVPFHLVAEVAPDQPFTVADFQARARTAVAEIWSRGRLPVLCGGTGLYVRALLRHWRLAPPPDPAQSDVRGDLQRTAEIEGTEGLYSRLQAVDPVTAARLSPHDARRIIRALEVWEHSAQRISEAAGVDPSPPVGYNWLGYVVTCPRELLYARIERRVAEMWEAGWLEEVRALRAADLSPSCPALRALGYRPLWALLEGALNPEEAREGIRRATRQFAKRQLTWFRREPGFGWMTWSGEGERQTWAAHLTEAARHLRRQAEDRAQARPASGGAPDSWSGGHTLSIR